MRTIGISEEVWQEIAKRGKFGETEDDVLRREFKLPEASGSTQLPPLVERGSPSLSSRRPSAPNGRMNTRRASLATRRMSSYVSGGRLHVGFEGERERSWPLPDRSDKVAIRRIRDEAVDFARAGGATIGQENAVKKALTESGFHLMK